MDNIFMNSKNGKRSVPHSRLLPNPTDKINLKRGGKHVALSNLAFTINEKILKSHIRTINLKFQLQHGMKNLKYLMDHFLY